MRIALAQEARELDSVGAGHHQVDDGEIEVLRREQAKRAFGVPGRFNVEPFDS